MKLFNTKINLNFIKNSAKFLILAFLIIYCIYILYFSSLKTVESFANTYDCSKCEVKPTSGNCIKIYDISYHKIQTDGGSDFFTISYEKIDTGYVFCPWEPNCDISNNYMGNMLGDDIRKGISNEDLQANMFGSLNNIRCCSNTSPWYNTNTINYNNISTIINNKTDCNTVNSQVQTFLNSLGPLSIKNVIVNSPNNIGTDVDLADIFGGSDKYLDFRTQCNTNYDFSGILFKEVIDNSGHVLQDPRLRKSGLTRKTIIDNIISKQQLIDISDGAIKEKESDGSFKTGPFGNKIMKTNYSYNEIRVKKDEGSFYQVIDKHNQRLNALKTLNMSDADFEQTLIIILYDLVAHYNLAPSNYNNKDGYYDNSYQIFNYVPSKDTNASIINAPPDYSKEYILDENEFLNCFGEIESVHDLSFNFTALGDFFGSSDPNLTTFEQASPNNYGPSAELEMELRRLQNVPPGGNAPVGVINQYLNAINGFYERQISNMMGPKTHTPNNQLVFENDNLEIKTPTFFKYETDPNNKYECQPSITGNDKFKDCGPTAYYTEFKP
tara:strand:- start:6148 stop:7806 length:1659 start_codon:yes stop_codon:yes gene_type:complete